MNDDFLFLQNRSQTAWPGDPFLSLGGGEPFRGIEGTIGNALLLPLQSGMAVPPSLAASGDWYRCRLVSDSRGRTEIAAAAMMLITFDVPDDQVGAFDEWYEQEHFPMLMRADGWLHARRFAVTERGPGSAGWTSLAVHLLASLDALDSEERRLARSTPWRARFASLPWFAAAGRFLYRPETGKD